ncbi:TetR/AcrR family transcriptional regulator [Nocardiopsis sp. MG754419]|uniref:TetR/AcrR family transcriptional regulator n=1 Tax=Nocardiopsis sp. MG754419 TaxID=2259865 RepID=UPI001BAACC44|nr:TetR/AcrR family transcriptional regulator [Nocardiopsis sp. MG754419]MBR8745245.1 TetR/AcrR family transcriptional regulator [Nocardiopsis sp. MG754419]
MTRGRRPRVGIERRRERILAAAIGEFGDKGFHGGSTVTIARDVAFPHPNLFRAYSTKKGLFLAALERTFATIERETLLREEEAEDDRLEAMAHGWGVLLENRDAMPILLQGYTACEDPDVRGLMHGWRQEVFERAEAIPGVGSGPAHDFFAAGMPCLVTASMDLHGRVEDGPWNERFPTSDS